MKINDRTYLLRQNEELFIATLQEFSLKSYVLASTNEIIKKSNYNKGSFYYRFKTKDDIYFALIDYVYTTQISLFNNQNFKVNNLVSLEEIIRLMFEQLKQLYIIDNRYIDLLNMIYIESVQFNDYIRQNCIESQLERFIMRLEIILRRSYSQLETEIFLDLLTFAYHNKNIDFNNNYDEYVENVIKFLITGHKKATTNLSKAEFDFDDIENNFTVLLSKYGTLATSDSENIVYISRMITDQQESIKEIKDKLKIQKITLENIIRSGIKKNLQDYEHLLDLLSLDYAQISYHNLTNLQKIILLTTYNVLLGKEMIIVDYQIKFIYFNDTKVLFNEIAPILCKTSKIVVLEEVINLIPSIYKNIYYINAVGIIKKLQNSEVVVDLIKDIVIDYYDEQDNLKTEYFARKDPIILTYLKDYKIININTYTRLSIDDLI
ncbi:MAG: TetR/AcrR family transcriptional regulator [Tenericutes bacterium]|nr:TetR/AcrR family transcriptional regulator [Mycoplasmatota bacterium]